MCVALIAAVAACAQPYLDIMEQAVAAYSDAHVVRYVQDVEAHGVQEHGFPRLAANLGVLVANGRLPEKKDLLRRMMTAGCRDAAKGKMPPKSGGNEFSVKELAFALDELERAGTFPKPVTDAWRADLTSVDARRCYTKIPRADAPQASNWTVFGCASEQVRLSLGLGGDPEFVEFYVADQLKWFDELGMYRDPAQPAVYDFVTRLQFAHILSAGYDGPSHARLEALMEKSAEPTLKMQSACGEIPYGGRSNQFLHNNTFYAALCEWYAAWYAKRREPSRVRAFKAAAKRAVDALDPWLKRTPVSHVKNGYARESGKGVYSERADMGCERYAYFDKYMITMGSWAMSALKFCTDWPEAADAEPDGKPSVFVTSPEFHWVFLSAGAYSAQFDWDANPDYDSSGLGRLQRRGAPSALCLSTPCARHPHYRREIEDGPDLALVPVVPDGTPLRLRKRFADAKAAHAEWTTGGLDWACALSADGLVSTLKGPADVALVLPAFESDGARTTEVACDGTSLAITYGGWICRYVVEKGKIVATDVRSANRNGVYRRYEAHGDRRLVVRVSIGKASSWAK